jgi:hypothetical protein
LQKKRKNSSFKLTTANRNVNRKPLRKRGRWRQSNELDTTALLRGQPHVSCSGRADLLTCFSSYFCMFLAGTQFDDDLRQVASNQRGA